MKTANTTWKVNAKRENSGTFSLFPDIMKETINKR